VTNCVANSVEILLGYGDGTFGNHMTSSPGCGSGPESLTVGDFNSDNQLDIVTANNNGNSIGILLGYGNGTFADNKTYSTGSGSQPIYISVGDFNQDNISDIAVTNHFANNIGIFLGYGSQPFAGVTTYSTGHGSQPHSVVIGDLNYDSRSDIVVANYGTDNVGILFGRKDGTFDPIIAHHTGNGSAPYSVAVADFNSDKHLDIVVTNSENDNIAILLGYGNRTFASRVTYSTGVRSRPYTVVIGDFNNDNISDIGIANSGTSNIFLLYGNGNGTFGNQKLYPLGYGYHPYSIAATDLNQDDWMDIVIACFDTDHVETLIKMC
jgi:hypothetical protein